MTRTPLAGVRRMADADKAMKTYLETNQIVDENGEPWVPKQLPPDPDDPDRK